MTYSDVIIKRSTELCNETNMTTKVSHIIGNSTINSIETNERQIYIRVPAFLILKFVAKSL